MNGTRRGTVVCLHGFPDGPQTFGPLTALIQRAGFEVVAPLLPGHAPESAEAFLTERGPTLPRALTQLGRALAPREPPVHLIGHDWGAVLGYALVGQISRPSRYSSIEASWPTLSSFTALAIPPLCTPVSSALAHPRALARFDYLAAFQVPGLGERLLASRTFLTRLTGRWSPGFELPSALLDDVAVRYTSAAVRHSVLAYYRALRPRLADPFDVVTTWRLLTASPRVPTLVVHGDRDGCFAPAVFPGAVAAVRSRGASIDLLTLPDVGHFPQLEDPHAVFAAWLASLPAGS